MTNKAKITLKYIANLIIPKPAVIAEEQCSTQTIPIAFKLNSEQTNDLWQKFVEKSKSTITFFDFSTIKIIQLCEFMDEKFDSSTLFYSNILSNADEYSFDEKATEPTASKATFNFDISALRQKYPESVIAGVYNPLSTHAKNRYFGSDIPANVQLSIARLNNILFQDGETKFDILLQNFTPILLCMKEIDACIANEKKYNHKEDCDNEEECDGEDEYDDENESESEVIPVFVDGFFSDLVPTSFDADVCHQIRRAGHKIYFGRYADTIQPDEMKKYQKLSMKIIKLKDTIEGGGFYWVRCPNDPAKIDEINDILY